MTETRSVRAYADVALGRQRSPQNETGPHMVRYLRAANVKDGSLDLTDVKEMNFEPSEQERFALRPGDVLVTEGSGSITSVGASAVWRSELEGVVCFQNTLLRLRPRPSTDERFLAWWCRHAFASGLFASVSTGANIFHLSAERLRTLPMTYLPLSRQRSIADFLDAETARIDAIAHRKDELAQMLLSRWATNLCSTLLPGGLDSAAGRPRQAGWPVRPLRRLLAKSWGGDWGDEPGENDAELPCVRAADFDFVRLCATTGASRSFTLASASARCLQPGDLVIEKSGGGEGVPVGRVVAWRGEGRAVPTNFAGGLRPGSDVDPDFLLLALRAAYEVGLPWRSIKQTTGLQNLDLGHYLSHYWPVPSRPEQTAIARDLLSELERVLAVQLKLREQITLLQEHRQALITAAVTGDLQVPGVAA